jgi:hypothetical protein
MPLKRESSQLKRARLDHGSDIANRGEVLLKSKPITRKKYTTLLIEGILFFVFSVYVTHLASRFATLKASNSVDDLILSNTPVYNFEFLFVELAIALCLFVVVLCIKFPKTAPFVLKSVGLFIIIRSVFVTLTHIGPFPTKLVLESNLLDFITTGNDLFFSGHTGLPFLIALIYWDHIYIRRLFILASGIFGVVVLLSHLHYSIDVFAALFITYTIYHIAIKLFALDYRVFSLKSETKLS